MYMKPVMQRRRTVRYADPICVKTSRIVPRLLIPEIAIQRSLVRYCGTNERVRSSL